MFSAFNPSKCTHLEQWAADCAAGAVMDFLSEPGFEPTTLGYMSNALSIRPTTAHYKCSKMAIAFIPFQTLMTLIIDQ